MAKRMTKEEKRIAAKRYIQGLWNEVASECYIDLQGRIKTDTFEKIQDKGWKKVNSDYFDQKYEKNGMTINFWWGCEKHHLSRSFIFGKYRFSSIVGISDEAADALIKEGCPTDYVRSEAITKRIAEIKAKQKEVEERVNKKGGYGEIGDFMRSFGCYVNYDGGSCSTFSKDFLECNAHTNDYPKQGWHLTNGYRLLYADGTTSMEFHIDHPSGYIDLDTDYEAIFGTGEPKELGRFYTEKERFEKGWIKYDKYVVCYNAPKNYERLEVFDTFEEAKKNAYERAKAAAENTPRDLRRYTYTNPIDVSNRDNDLASYQYYNCDGYRYRYCVEGYNK